MKNEKIPAFYLHVDGKKYGPYKTALEEKVKRLTRLRGVVIEHVMLDKEAFSDTKRKKRVKPENLSLLVFDPDWRPTCRRQKTLPKPPLTNVNSRSSIIASKAITIVIGA